MEYVPIYTPGSVGESAFLESLLSGNGIRYFIHNDNTARIYGSLGLTQRSIYVHPRDYVAARELLKDLLIDKPIPQNILNQIEVENFPEKVSPEDTEASYYQIITVAFLIMFLLFFLYKINSR